MEPTYKQKMQEARELIGTSVTRKKVKREVVGANGLLLRVKTTGLGEDWLHLDEWKNWKGK
jgi:hypothetical protein